VADGSLRVHSRLQIPLREIELRTSRSSGPGGQHANVTASRVEAVLDVAASETLSPGQARRITEKLGPVVRAIAQDERSQARNRALALERLAEKLAGALARPKKRRATRPTAAAKEKRLEGKRRQAEKKRARRRPDAD
jgi:ribosome-associated protein